MINPGGGLANLVDKVGKLLLSDVMFVVSFNEHAVVLPVFVLLWFLELVGKELTAAQPGSQVVKALASEAVKVHLEFVRVGCVGEAVGDVGPGKECLHYIQLARCLDRLGFLGILLGGVAVGDLLAFLLVALAMGSLASDVAVPDRGATGAALEIGGRLATGRAARRVGRTDAGLLLTTLLRVTQPSMKVHIS